MTNPQSIRASKVVLKLKSLDELSARWNGWQLDAATFELSYSDPSEGNEYSVDLERFCNSAQVLDVILQVAAKRWATDQCLAGLIRGINDVMQPQANLCTGGVDKTITRQDVGRLVTARAGRNSKIQIP